MKLNQLLKEVFNVSDTDYNDSSELISFREWDSMTHMLFITRLEEAYEVVLDGDEIANMNSVGDIKKLLASKGKTL
jgi:acyl carrier protein